MLADDPPKDDASVLDRWLGYGVDLAGALVGVGVGTVVAGPLGGAYGAVIGTGLTAALGEASARMISKREKSRIGAVVLLARVDLIERLGDGQVLRGDEFIRARLDGRSAADEVIEHVLQVAQRSFEERKLPHVAATLSAVAVTEWLDERTAHWLITTLENLSWPKLVALALIEDRGTNPLPNAAVGQSPGDWTPWSLHNMFLELQNADGLISREPRTGAKGAPDFSSYFSDLRLTAGGRLLVWASNLTSISAAEQDEMRAAIVAP